MSCRIAIQYAVIPDELPDRGAFRRWVRAALRVLHDIEHCDITLRIVGEPESRRLNQRFRHKRGSTNVLSFSYGDDQSPALLLGDIVICAPVVRREAKRQGKVEEAHWAHMVVHGIMHLSGCDHETADESALMEGLETRVLGRLGFPNPY